MSGARRVLFVVTEDWYFVSHRLQLARRLQAAGMQVAVAARFTSHRAAIEAEGIRCIPLRLRRTRHSLWGEVRSIIELRSVVRREAPDILHCVALKPVVFAGLATFGMRRPVTVNAIAGLGFLFSLDNAGARVGRLLLTGVLRLVLRRPSAWIIVQNSDDAATLAAADVGAPDRTRLIRGAGVELDVFRPGETIGDPPVVLMASRMLRDKGVTAFVEAAQSLRARGTIARFQLAGSPDPDNPASHTEAELRAWSTSGIVEWLGRRDDMPAVLASAAVVCLPTTYGEGVPKVLIEAAASARAIVATDWAGCREIVRHGVNGLLVPARDHEALCSALSALIADPQTRQRMGDAGRALVELEFGIDAVTDATRTLYAEALA